MISLAALRYRNVLSDFGGPVTRVEVGPFPMRGRALMLANAILRPGLSRRMPANLFNGASDGSGLHPLAIVARHMAISEAMERWAFSVLVCSEQAEVFGFDIDPSSNGMSAFPGIFPKQARRRSVLEAIERFCLCAWWEGSLDGHLFDTDWPGISAVAIDGPFGGITVVAFARTPWGGYVYGHAADESFSTACERAVHELARHEWVLRAWWLTNSIGPRIEPANLLERRCVYFSGEEGYEKFGERLRRRAWRSHIPIDVICDRELVGPWSDYATVWRFALRPPSDAFFTAGADYFFL